MPKFILVTSRSTYEGGDIAFRSFKNADELAKALPAIIRDRQISITDLINVDKLEENPTLEEIVELFKSMTPHGTENYWAKLIREAFISGNKFRLVGTIPIIPIAVDGNSEGKAFVVFELFGKRYRWEGEHSYPGIPYIVWENMETLKEVRERTFTPPPVTVWEDV